MRAPDTLRAEHEGVLAVLAHLDRAVTAAEQGARVPVDVFADIQEFFAVFVDRCHHGKEEAMVFPRLAAKNADLVRQLESEHSTGRLLAAAYADALREHVPGDFDSGERLAGAARKYAAFLRDHIEVENARLLPAMEGELVEGDEELVEAFERHEIQEIGAGTHDRLHSMIESLGPRLHPYVSA